jgi:hypothetical protein
MTEQQDFGANIDDLYALREKRLKLQKQLEDMRKKEQDAETRILATLNATGLNKASGNVATVSRKSTIVPQVEDWDEFYNFLHEHKFYHLLQRRVSIPAYTEALELHGGVPGTTQFTKQKLSLTKASR